MIIIDMPEISSNGNETVIKSKYNFKGKDEYLWFSLPQEYSKYLVVENADAFVVGLLLLGMREGQNIKVNGTISEKLYYTLNNYVIDALHLADEKWRKIEISASELSDKNLNTEKMVGTGISCGIDSFTTIYEHLNYNDKFKVNYFTFLNAGSHGDYGGDEARKLYNSRLIKAKSFAREYGADIISIDTNMNEILNMNHEKTHIIRSISCLLNLQKLFKYYYYASARRFDYYKLSNAVMSEYDILILGLLCTESTSFISTASQYTRIERTRLITNYEPTYKYLDVCTNDSQIKEAGNCSYCDKCMRTQLTLDILGKLDLYKDVFHLKLYNKNKCQYIGRVLAEKNKSVYNREMIDLIKEKKFKIPFKSYLYYIRYKEINFRLKIINRLQKV